MFEMPCFRLTQYASRLRRVKLGIAFRSPSAQAGSTSEADIFIAYCRENERSAQKRAHYDLGAR